MILSDLEWANFFLADLLNNARTVWPRTTKFGSITCVGTGEWRISSLSGTSLPPATALLNFWSSFIFTVWRKTTNLTWQHVGRGLVLWVSHAATTRGSAPVSPIFGYPSIYLYTFCSRTTKFDVVTHVGRGLYLGVIHASHIPRERGSSTPQFWGFSCIYAYILWTQNDQIQHSACSKSATRGRFVSDSWVSCMHGES